MADYGQLKTQLGELIKQYIVYDAANRPEYVYTAREDLEHGKPCSVVRYAYRTPTSKQVEYMKEYVGTWDESWEAF